MDNEEFINFVNRWFGYPEDGQMHIDPMDLSDEEFYEIEDAFYEETDYHTY